MTLLDRAVEALSNARRLPLRGFFNPTGHCYLHAAIFAIFSCMSLCTRALTILRNTTRRIQLARVLQRMQQPSRTGMSLDDFRDAYAFAARGEGGGGQAVEAWDRILRETDDDVLFRLGAIRFIRGRCRFHRDFPDFESSLDLNSPFEDPRTEFDDFLNPPADWGACGHPTRNGLCLNLVNRSKAWFRRSELPDLLVLHSSQADPANNDTWVPISLRVPASNMVEVNAIDKEYATGNIAKAVRGGGHSMPLALRIINGKVTKVKHDNDKRATFVTIPRKDELDGRFKEKFVDALFFHAIN